MKVCYHTTDHSTCNVGYRCFPFLHSGQVQLGDPSKEIVQALSKKVEDSTGGEEGCGSCYGAETPELK